MTNVQKGTPGLVSTVIKAVQKTLPTMGSSVENLNMEEVVGFLGREKMVLVIKV